MSAQPRYFRLGAFVLLGFFLFVGGILLFGGGQMFRPKVFCVTYVNGSVQGIEIGTPVKFRGVQIGRVRTLDFAFNVFDDQQIDDQAKNYVVLLMEIDQQVSPGMFDEHMAEAMTENISRGLRVRIEPQGITGLNYLDFGFVDPTRFPPLYIPWKSEYFYVPYAPGEITNALDSINNIMREVEKLNIAGISESTHNLLQNLNKAVVDARISDLSASLEQFVEDLQAALKQADLGQVSAEIQSLSREVAAAVEAAKVGEVSSDTRKLLNELRSSNARLERMLANLEPSTRIGPTDLPTLMRNTAAASENLRQMTEELKRRPSLLLWGTPKSAKRPAAQPSPTPQDLRQSPVPPKTPARGFAK